MYIMETIHAVPLMKIPLYIHVFGLFFIIIIISFNTIQVQTSL